MPHRAATGWIFHLPDLACRMRHSFPVHGDILPSLLGEGQKRFIRMDTLGAGYTPDDLRAIIAGTKAHTPKKKRVIPAPFYAYTSETLCYKMDRQLEVIPWRVRVSLPCSSNGQNRPLKKRTKNTVGTATALPTTFFPTGRIRRKASAIPIWRRGIRFRHVNF